MAYPRYGELTKTLDGKVGPGEQVDPDTNTRCRRRAPSALHEIEALAPNMPRAARHNATGSGGRSFEAGAKER